MIIENLYLRILLTPLFFFYWLFMTVTVYSFGCFIGGLALLCFPAMLFDGQDTWEEFFKLVFTAILAAGFTIISPLIWWYRYFKEGKIGLLEEFKT